MLRPSLRAFLVLAALPALAPACSRPQRQPWPTRNYSGVYHVRASVDSNSCPTPVFAAGDTLRFTLVQSPLNEAAMDIPPVVSARGDFAGDHLEARAAVSARPTGAAAGSTAAPGDSIRYKLQLDFSPKGFRGTYRVDQPALGSGVKACAQVFRVEGQGVEAGGGKTAG